MTQIPVLFKSKKKQRQEKKIKHLDANEAQFLIDNIKLTIKEIEHTNYLLQGFVSTSWDDCIPDGSSKSQEAFKSLNDAKDQQRYVKQLLNKFAAIQHKLKTYR